MNKLQVSTEVPNEILMTRTFDAPRKLVIEAMTKPELIKRWMGGVRATVSSVEIDMRVAGTYRYVFRRPDGVSFTLSGVYREVSDERVVMTQRLDDNPAELVVTTTLIENDGKTTMTVVVTAASKEMRDAIMATGMTTGAGETYDQLDALLASR